MKRGAANYGMDFAFGTALLIIFIIFTSAFRGCIDTVKEKEVKREAQSVDMTGVAMTFLRMPTTFQGKYLTYGDLIVEYYLLRGNKNRQEQISDFLWGQLQEKKFTGLGYEFWKCRKLQVKIEGKDDLLSVGPCEDFTKPPVIVTLPLPLNAEHKFLTVQV